MTMVLGLRCTGSASAERSLISKRCDPDDCRRVTQGRLPLSIDWEEEQFSVMTIYVISRISPSSYFPLACLAATILHHSTCGQSLRCHFPSLPSIYAPPNLEKSCPLSHPNWERSSYCSSHFFSPTQAPSKLFSPQQFLLLFVLRISQVGITSRMARFLVNCGLQHIIILLRSLFILCSVRPETLIFVCFRPSDGPS